jgi:hypothetical protein
VVPMKPRAQWSYDVIIPPAPPGRQHVLSVARCGNMAGAGPPSLLLSGRSTRVWRHRDGRLAPGVPATSRERGRVYHPARERPVEPDASRGARPVRGRLLEVIRVQASNLQLLSHGQPRPGSGGDRDRPGQSMRRLPPGRDGQSGCVRDHRTNPPAGFEPKLKELSG